MKKGFIFSVISLSLLFLINSCNDKNKESLFEETFLIVTHKIVENYENSKLIDKKNTKYFYERKNDYFWYKAITNDSSGKVIRTVDRKLDIKSRLPVQELIKEKNGIITKSILKYSIDNYDLLFKEDYLGNNKIRSMHWDYDKAGYLSSIEDTIYESNGIQKINNVNYLPNIGKPKGYYPISAIVNLKKVYNPSLINNPIQTFMITKFDSLKYPYFDSVYQSDMENKAKVNWYKVIVDDSQIVSLIAYNDRDFKSSIAGDSQINFEYNSDWFLEKIESFKYKELSGEYEIFNGSQSYEWIVPKFKSRHNFTDYNLTSINLCSESKKHTKYIKKIVRFDDVGEKIVEEYSGTFSGDCDEDTQIKTELVKRTIYVFNKLEIKGETAVIYKNKKVEQNLKLTK